MSESETTGEPTTPELVEWINLYEEYVMTNIALAPWARNLRLVATRLESLQRENDALRRRLEALEVESLKAEEPE